MGSFYSSDKQEPAGAQALQEESGTIKQHSIECRADGRQLQWPSLRHCSSRGPGCRSSPGARFKATQPTLFSRLGRGSCLSKALLLGASGQHTTGCWARACLGGGGVKQWSWGMPHTCLARNWLGTEDSDGVMCLDEGMSGVALRTKSPQSGCNSWNTSAALPSSGSVLDTPHRGRWTTRVHV